MTEHPRIQIMPIGAAELGRVRSLADRIWPECFAGILPADRIAPMVTDIYAIETLQADLAERRHSYWIAQVDGADVGYASAFREGDRLWLKKLYLLGVSRGMGLGKQLMPPLWRPFPDAARSASSSTTATPRPSASTRPRALPLSATFRCRWARFSSTTMS